MFHDTSNVSSCVWLCWLLQFVFEMEYWKIGPLEYEPSDHGIIYGFLQNDDDASYLFLTYALSLLFTPKLFLFEEEIKFYSLIQRIIEWWRMLLNDYHTSLYIVFWHIVIASNRFNSWATSSWQKKYPGGYTAQVTGLSPRATEKDVYDFFAYCGGIEHVEIIR